MASDTIGNSGSIVVMKFGGTSTADHQSRKAVVGKILNAIKSGLSPVVVVSAMGRQGSPYATDTLLALLDEGATDPQDTDLLLSTGEIISAVVVAQELRAAGILAKAISGGDAGLITEENHGDARIVAIYPDRIIELIQGGCVPVVAGFQGVSVGGSTTTLGRGGSDTTACALGVALDAAAVEIYSDVEGVATADPRACDGTRILEVIGADELFQLARHGARVVHAPAADLALRNSLRLRIRGTFSADEGTMVLPDDRYSPTGVATALSHTTDIVRVRVDLSHDEGSPDHMKAQSEVYSAMALRGISLDMFTPAGRHLIFTTSFDCTEGLKAALDALSLPYDLQTDLSKITLVGAGMHGVPGVIAKMSECLNTAGVPVLQSSDSHTTISVIVNSRLLRVALEALSKDFDLGNGNCSC
ncbi:MAG: aspartate kinase [Actinobacteria bacterium]|nr:aspartate kinase [Actinomycetota bacterium]MCL5887577.1 aspartate kinase [Actinomycetota bacterium]